MAEQSVVDIVANPAITVSVETTQTHVIETIIPQEFTPTPVIKRDVVVEVIHAGPQGPVGPIANQENIDSMVSSMVNEYLTSHATFIFEQTTEVYDWIIDHTLNRWPAVTTVDSSGTELIGEVTWPLTSQVRIHFTTPVAGRAILT